MLILTRRVGESIVVGDDIVLTVFEVRGDAVRVGIEAPRSVEVHRQEVYDELKRLNAQAASTSDDAVDALREAMDKTSAPSRKPDLSVVPEVAPDEDSAAQLPPAGEARTEPPTGKAASGRPRPGPPRRGRS